MPKREPRTVLLVEDEESIAAAERSRLELAGYRAVHAASGEEALAIARSDTAELDLLLIEIDLGAGIDGVSAAREILAIRELPVLFLSSQTEKGFAEKTEQVPNYGYVQKGSGAAVLDASIRMAFKLFEAQRENRSQKEAMEAAYAETRAANETLQRTQRDLMESEAAVRDKLKAIMEPDGDIAGLELSDIVDASALQSLMEEFYDLTGILGAILDVKGNILVATGWQDICTKFHRCNPRTARFCKESDTELTLGVPDGAYKVYRCKNNMWDMVTPLYLDNHHIGNIFIGQFIYEDEEVDEELYRRQARRYGFDEERYMAALAEVPRFSREKVNRGIAFYSRIAKMISNLSYSSIKLSRAIAEKDRAKEEIKKLLDEKELILKEVHHRIQNNMSAIKALLMMQAEALGDEDVKNLFLEAEARVESIRNLYDKLYRSDDFRSVSLRDYLGSLLGEIVAIFPKKYELTVSSHIADTALSAKLVSSVGIIINELVTNSMKYAFADRKTGAISLRVEAAEGSIRIEYSDDGVGLPESVSMENSGGFGMQIITMLVQQINGTIEIERGAGTKYRIAFAA